MHQPTHLLRRKVIQVYKELFYLGKEYPGGSKLFHQQLKSSFMKNAHLTDPNEIQAAIDRANYVKKEIEALYALKKYRSVQKRYDQL
ncbi:hypothetical protein HMI55_006580 [Coelomomyces lativittatus]|nr:hypothetical protein HMI56_001384 [Coelomomyces lativittatus]KAJ1511476.1 hypothetical protein HMI55_006580 [Coelomomyces lativittatus]